MAPVLVVEDDEAIREVLYETLTDEGFEVRTAINGAEALSVLATSEAPCLILLDIMMPVMDGYEFLDALRSTAHCNDSVVIMSAAAIDRPVTVNGILRKPIPLELLIATVREHCSAPHN